MADRVISYLAWALGRAGYVIRPYDMVADRRRWFWQSRERCVYLAVDDPYDDGGCCVLDEGHDGACAWVCSECNGTQRCWACGGPSGDDIGNGCGECDGDGHCHHCYEGMVSDV